MPIVNILKRASSYIYGSEDENDSEMKYSDNEILFCKNNVCVHPPTMARQEYDVVHHPGYLTVTTKTFIDQYNNAKRPTLFLNWIPNTTLRKCPSTVENNVTDELKQHFHEPQEIKQNGKNIELHSNESTIINQSPVINNHLVTQTCRNTNPFLEPYPVDEINLEVARAIDLSESLSMSSVSDKLSSLSAELSPQRPAEEEPQFCDEQEPLLRPGDTEPAVTFPESIPEDDHSVTSVSITIADPLIENIAAVKEDTFMRSVSVSSCEDSISPNWMSTPELFALKHNLSFPESVSASPVLTRKMPLKCRR